MSRLKMMFVASLVTLTALAGVAAAKGKHHGPRAEQRKAQRLAQFDANKNGVLDPAEKQAMHDKLAAERFAKLDANKDGRITLDEFKAGRMAKRGRGPGSKPQP